VCGLFGLVCSGSGRYIIVETSSLASRDCGLSTCQNFATTRQPTNMSWTLETPQSDGTLGILPLPNDGVAHIVVISGDTAPILVQELQQVHTELGRIS
jgi:hypothetical protein